MKNRQSNSCREKTSSERADDAARRLAFALDVIEGELTLEFRRAAADSVEQLAPGAQLERAHDGRALRIRLAELKEPWLTNVVFTRSMACTTEGCHPVEGPGGSQLYQFCIGLPEMERALYDDPETMEPAPSSARDSMQRAEAALKEYKGFLSACFLRLPSLKEEFPNVYERSRELIEE